MIKSFFSKLESLKSIPIASDCCHTISLYGRDTLIVEVNKRLDNLQIAEDELLLAKLGVDSMWLSPVMSRY